MLKLTFHLEDDWPRLDHFGVDAQSAAIVPSIHSLHMGNAEKQYRETFQSLLSAYHITFHL